MYTAGKGLKIVKVLQINTVCGAGSTGRITVNLARMLENAGEECLIAYGRGNAPKGVNAWQFGSRSSIYQHGIMTRLTDRHGMYSKHATKQLLKKIEEYDPDVIHLHNLHGYYLNIDLLFHFLKAYGKPVVWTLHDCWSFTGHCTHYTCVGCEKWKTECFHCPLKKDYPSSFLMDQSRRNYRKKKELFTSLPYLQLVTPSKWLKEQVDASFFAGKIQAGELPECVVIPNGIETEQFVSTDSNLRCQYHLEDKIVILGVANVWTKQKGIEDFIRLSCLLDQRYQLVMIGVDAKRRKRLSNYNIVTVGHTKKIEELIAWYSTADIYFNSSIEETMGMTTGEAICCETPVVAYDSTAVPESVGPDCGIVVPANDVGAVKNAIETMMENYAVYTAGCRKYRSQFEKEKANHAYYEIYRESNRQAD
jgi:glycosyltransferase involved in cell wall biosynthesis